MSKAREAHEKAREAREKTREAVGGKHANNPSRKNAAAQRGSTGTSLPGDFPPPLRPRPVLLAISGLLLVCLAAGLLVLYFTTVYPYRYQRHAVETDHLTHSTTPAAPGSARGAGR